MRDALLVLLLLGGFALLVIGAARVTSRRRAAEEGFVAERQLPPDLRAAMMAQRLSDQAPAAGPTGSATAPAPDGSPGPAAAPVRSPMQHVPLVDALTGMQLPCDLTFLGTVEAEPGVREVLAFSTATHGASGVFSAMNTELDRLGYTLFSGGERVTMATRDDLSLRMEVHPHPSSVMRKKKPAFPTAPPGSVVVEVTRS